MKLAVLSLSGTCRCINDSPFILENVQLYLKQLLCAMLRRATLNCSIFDRCFVANMAVSHIRGPKSGLHRRRVTKPPFISSTENFQRSVCLNRAELKYLLCCTTARACRQRICQFSSISLGCAVVQQNDVVHVVFY